MYKLIFADDEGLVRNNLSKMIDWNANGFELVCCCANGHDLIESAEKYRPDVIITDINMPYVSGLEASRQIRADFPSTRIVFLTGYDDFDYAQQAVDLKAEKYIVKPIDADCLSEILTEIKMSLDREYTLYKDITMLKEFYGNHQGIMRSLFLNNILLTGASDKNIEQKARLLGLEWLFSKLFHVAIVKYDDGRQNEDNSELTHDLANFALYNIANELIADTGAAVMMDDCTALVFYTENPDEKQLYEVIERVMGEIIGAVEKYLKFPVIAGIGKSCLSSQDIHQSYDEAAVALGYSRELGGNRVISVEDVGAYRHNFKRFDIQKESRLLEAIRRCDHQMMLSETKLILDRFYDADKNISKLYIFDLLLSLFSESEAFETDTRDIITPGRLADLLDTESKEEVYQTITGCCEKIIGSIERRKRSTYFRYLEQALEYIANNYAIPELSIDMLSEHMNLSASHLRVIFRKELNTTFTKYLNKVRLEEARKLILENSLKNYEISDAVGFNAPHYFSYCFKQHYGVSPNEMREKEINKMYD